MSEVHVWFHSNCYDGFGAAWAAWRKFGDRAKYTAVSYGNLPPNIPDGSQVFILDFSYPRETLIELANRMAVTVVLDHHATAQADLADLGDHSVNPPASLYVEFDMNKSGAMLAWEYFAGHVVPALVPYIQDRDLWKFELPSSREVNAALRSYPFDFKVWGELNVYDLATEGVPILRHTDQMVEVMCKNVVMREVGGYFVPVANATVYFSEVGQRLLELFPGAPFAAYYMDRSDGKRQWGLRSRLDFDCSEIARKYGGGGHKTAAGFVTESGEVLV